MKTTRKIIALYLYSIIFILLPYSYAYSQTNTYNRNSGYGAIWGIIICAWICNKRRENPIGGWLLYYYIQLYIGMIWFSIFTLTSLENYIPGNWDDSTFYLFYILSVFPQDLAIIAELIVASLLLKKRFRNSSKVNLLKVIFIFSIIFSIIGLTIDYFYWKENIPFDIFGLVSSSVWLLYFIYSQRVKSVLIDNNWEPYKGMSYKIPESSKTPADEFSQPTNDNSSGKPTTINKFKIFSSFKKISKGLFRLIVVFSFLVSIIIGYIAEINQRYSDGETFIISFILSMIIYWSLIRIGIWIYDGFMEDKI